MLFRSVLSWQVAHVSPCCAEMLSTWQPVPVQPGHLVRTRSPEFQREAESLSDAGYSVQVKWSKIQAEGKRSYQRCYGAPFLLQISGSGLVAPCGMLFNERYKKFHIGNIVHERFRDIILGDRYWEVVNYLASDEFDARRQCGTLCLQHATNTVLDRHIRIGEPLGEANGSLPRYASFI